MSVREPRRLLEVGRDDVHENLRALLIAGRAELPSQEQLARMARGAGLQLGAAETNAPNAAAHASAASSGVWPVLKLGVLLAAAGTGVFAFQHSHATQPAQRSRAAQSQQTHEIIAPAQPHALPRAAPSTAVVATPAASAQSAVRVDTAMQLTSDQSHAETEVGTAQATHEAPVPTGRRATTSAHRASPRTSDPVAELALLDAAQHALHDEPERALARVNEHSARFARGEFEQEREVLAIEALMHLGRNRTAAQRASRFLARYPDSCYRARVEQQLRGSGRVDPGEQGRRHGGNDQ